MRKDLSENEEFPKFGYGLTNGPEWEHGRYACVEVFGILFLFMCGYFGGPARPLLWTVKVINLKHRAWSKAQ